MLLTRINIPKPTENSVHRTVLFEKLNEGLKRKLILISAPAGFGKTTLVCDWILQKDIPSAWFSIDNNNNDISDFFAYVISAIQSLHPEVGCNALHLLKSSNPTNPTSVIDLLINDLLVIKKDFLLVWDDYHLIINPEIHRIAAYLIEHMPETMHVAIITRSDPGFPVAKLRSRNMLLELRSTDLKFSTVEISFLFSRFFKLKLSADEIEILESKTEGWIAGLQLAALSLQAQENKSRFIQNFAGNNRYIMDYLIEEVLKIQTDEIKEFLLVTSLLKQMSAPLCDFLLGRTDSQRLLDMMERNNMFVVPLDSEQTWYRYHHLFAHLLKQKLRERGKDYVGELHHKALLWFEKNQMFDMAVEHALEINEFDKAVQLLSLTVEDVWRNGQHSTIKRFGDLMSEELLKKYPEFSLYYAWVLIMAGQIQKAEVLLFDAEQFVRKTIDDRGSAKTQLAKSKKLLGKISVALAYLNSFFSLSTKSFDYCQTAMENLSEDDPLWFSWCWYSLGTTQSAHEKFADAIESYEKALAYGKKSENIFLISTIAMNLAYLESRMGMYTASYNKCSDLIAFMNDKGYAQLTRTECSYAALYSCMAGIHAMRAELDEALDDIKIAFDLSRTESNYSFKTVMLLVYSLVLQGRGDAAGSAMMLQEAEEIIQANKVAPGVSAIYIALKGSKLLAGNQLDQAKQLFERNGVGINNKISYINDRGFFPYALLLILEGQIKDAEKLLHELHVMSKSANRVEQLVEVEILLGFLYKCIGDKDKAVQFIIDAMISAEAENIILAFVIYYPLVNDLITDAIKLQMSGKTAISNNLIIKIKAAFDRQQKYISSIKDNELSIREVETLQLMAGDLSNQEIADKLFVSLNTTKTHVRNILQKLDVEKRSQAVVKAKEMGII